MQILLYPGGRYTLGQFIVTAATFDVANARNFAHREDQGADELGPI